MPTEIKITMSDDVIEVIEELKKAQNPSKKNTGQIIAQALAFYRLASQMYQNGYDICLIKNEEKQIIENIPFKRNN